MWDELTILWNDLTIDWNDLTIEWNDLTWNDLTMERNDRKPSKRQFFRLATAQDVSLQGKGRRKSLAARLSRSQSFVRVCYCFYGNSNLFRYNFYMFNPSTTDRNDLPRLSQRPQRFRFSVSLNMALFASRPVFERNSLNLLQWPTYSTWICR